MISDSVTNFLSNYTSSSNQQPFKKSAFRVAVYSAEIFLQTPNCPQLGTYKQSYSVLQIVYFYGAIKMNAATECSLGFGTELMCYQNTDPHTYLHPAVTNSLPSWYRTSAVAEMCVAFPFVCVRYVWRWFLAYLTFGSCSETAVQLKNISWF